MVDIRLISVASTIALLGCGPLEESSPGWVHARILEGHGGDTEALDYRGTGDFDLIQNRHIGNRWEFDVHSVSVDSGITPSSFTLVAYGLGLPRSGHYELRYRSFAELGVPAAEGFVATFARADAERDVAEKFMADSGQVVIHESSEDRVAGTFSFVGFRYCQSGPEPCESWPARRLDAARIVVNGSFEAHRWQGGPVEPLSSRRHPPRE